MKTNEDGISIIVLAIILIALALIAGISITYVIRDNGVISTAIKMELDTAKSEIRGHLLQNINNELLSCSTEIQGTSTDISTKFNEIRLINFLSGHNNYTGTDHDETAAVLCIERLDDDSNDENNSKWINPKGGNIKDLWIDDYNDVLEKGLATEDNKICNLYRVIPNALSSDTTYGKGKKISDGDIFVLEAVDESGNKIPEGGDSIGKYCLKYYDKDGKATVIETILLYLTNQS